MLKMTVISVCSESNKLLVHLTPKNSTSSEVYTSAEVDSRVDTLGTIKLYFFARSHPNSPGGPRNIIFGGRVYFGLAVGNI